MERSSKRSGHVRVGMTEDFTEDFNWTLLAHRETKDRVRVELVFVCVNFLNASARGWNRTKAVTVLSDVGCSGTRSHVRVARF